MMKYTVKRLFELLPLLFLISVAAFAMVRILPVDPATAYLDSVNIPVTDEAVAQIKEEMGLDKSIPVQYCIWLSNASKLDFGVSYQSKRLVTQEIASGLKYTLILAGFALLWVVLFSVPLGIISAVRPKGVTNEMIRILTFLLASIPEFWLGFLMVQFFSLKLGLFPVSGASGIRHIILPSLTLAMSNVASYTKLLRNSLLENFSQKYVLYARARGLTRNEVLFRHVLPNSLNPIITSLGLSLGGMLSGAVVVENVFAWPGLGQLIVKAVAGRDYPVIQGYVLIIAVIFIVCNFFADLLCSLLNPRIRLEA